MHSLRFSIFRIISLRNNLFFYLVLCFLDAFYCPIFLIRNSGKILNKYGKSWGLCFFFKLIVHNCHLLERLALTVFPGLVSASSAQVILPVVGLWAWALHLALCVVCDVRWKVFNILPVNMMFAVGFWWMFFTRLKTFS